MKIFAKDGEGFDKVKPREFRDEKELQALLERNPKLVPVEMDPRQWTKREFHTAAGSVDHVVVDATGKVLVVETKLARNSTRREVVAQAIDYAAQLTKLGPQAFLDAIRDRPDSDFTKDWFTSDIDREEFTRSLETNLRLGQLTLLIAMDHAESRLKDAVRFMNRATHFECLIAEIAVYIIEDQETVAVNLYGEESIADKRAPSRPALGMMDRADFLARTSENGLTTEGAAYLDALDRAEAAGAGCTATSAGIRLEGEPRQAQHHLMWQAKERTFHIWAPVGLYEAVRHRLDKAPAPWRERIHSRPLEEGKGHGKVADVDPTGITSVEEFGMLFRYYLEPFEDREEART